MSPNARRWCFKIVEPQTPAKEEILIGGLKNALERGETIEKAKQSFINAGYKPEEVTAAAQKVPAGISKINTSVTTTEKTTTPDKTKTTSSQTSPAAPVQKQQISKKFTIILISLASIVVIGLILVGIFWNKIF